MCEPAIRHGKTGADDTADRLSAGSNKDLE
jgi:hypothetical protein